MRIKIIIALFFFSTVSFGQTGIKSVLTNQICDCLDNNKKVKPLSENDFMDCLMTNFKADSNLIIKECFKLYGDTTETAAYTFGKKLAEEIAVSLVKDCKVYFQLMDSLRYNDYNGLNVDSIKSKLITLNKKDSSFRNDNYYYSRADLLFKLKDYDNALIDLDFLIKKNSDNPIYLFQKAWIKEIKGNYDDAIKLYDEVAKKTSISSFYIFSEIAKRKKTGM